MTQTHSNERAQRKSLAHEIDRLNKILDGLDEALAGAVEMAVRDVVGQVVKEAVEATLREVLSNPELLRAAMAQHTPVALPVQQPQSQPTSSPPRRPLKQWLQEKVAWFHRKASEKASQVKRKLSSAWFWCIEKVKQGCAWLWRRGKDSVAGCRHALRLSWFGLGCAWKFRRTSAVALGVGTLAGVGSYLAGPEIASAVCGLSGAAMTVAGMILWPLCRLLFASNNNS